MVERSAPRPAPVLMPSVCRTQSSAWFSSRETWDEHERVDLDRLSPDCNRGVSLIGVPCSVISLLTGESAALEAGYHSTGWVSGRWRPIRYGPEAAVPSRPSCRRVFGATRVLRGESGRRLNDVHCSLGSGLLADLHL